MEASLLKYFNTVQDSRCDKAYIDLCQDNIDFNTDMTVDAGEMTSIINDLSCNKSPGLDGLTAEYMKYVDSQLLVLLSVLVSSILVHGYIPNVITESVIVPVIKDKNRRVNDKGNYGPICHRFQDCRSCITQDCRSCITQSYGCLLANNTTSVWVLVQEWD